MKTLNHERCASPVGELVLLSDAGKLCYLDFADNAARMQKLLTARYRDFELQEGALAGMRARLARYFAGDWRAFDGLDLDTGGSQFQRLVWRSLCKIRVGGVITYKQLGNAIGRPAAARAVGAANARNPLSIVIPCHRVIGAGRDLRGYAGGIDRQAWLLQHEGAKYWRRPGERRQ